MVTEPSPRRGLPAASREAGVQSPVPGAEKDSSFPTVLVNFLSLLLLVPASVLSGINTDAEFRPLASFHLKKESTTSQGPRVPSLPFVGFPRIWRSLQAHRSSEPEAVAPSFPHVPSLSLAPCSRLFPFPFSVLVLQFLETPWDGVESAWHRDPGGSGSVEASAELPWGTAWTTRPGMVA